VFYVYCPCFSLVVFVSIFFFFTASSPSVLYTLSLHDALPIWLGALGFYGDEDLSVLAARAVVDGQGSRMPSGMPYRRALPLTWRSEEHTSELQSRVDLVCRLLLEKKKKTKSHKTLNNTTTNQQ